MADDEDPDRYRDPDAWPYRFELLRADWLFVDERYQRPVTKIADQIAAQFDRTIFEPILVSKRGRQRYAIADGQNRWEGYRRIGGRWMWAMVMQLTPQEEARKFSDLQNKRKNISPLERYKADLFAGDEEAVAVDALLRRHGLHTSDISGAYAEEDSVSAITAVRRGWARHGPMMDLVFIAIKASFPGQRGRYSGEIIGALLAFFETVKDFDLRRLIFALSSEIGTVHELNARSAAKRRATGTGMGGGSQVYTRRVIEESYRRVGRGAFRKQWEELPPLHNQQGD